MLTATFVVSSVDQGPSSMSSQGRRYSPALDHPEDVYRAEYRHGLRYNGWQPGMYASRHRFGVPGMGLDAILQQDHIRYSKHVSSASSVHGPPAGPRLHPRNHEEQQRSHSRIPST